MILQPIVNSSFSLFALTGSLPHKVNNRALACLSSLFSSHKLSFSSLMPLKAKVQEWEGSYYQENSSIQQNWAITFLKTLKGPFSGNILDVGCGTGHITAKIAAENPLSRVLGIDLSPSMIQTAKSGHLSSNLEFALGNSTHLKLSKKFNHIFSFSCFHWIENKKSALSNLRDLLADDGKLYLFFAPKNDYPNRIDKALFAVSAHENWKTFFQKPTKCNFFLLYPEEFQALLKEADLVSRHMQVVKTHSIFPHRDDFKKWMKGWTPHLQLLPEDLRDDFLDEVIDSYLSRTPLDAAKQLHYYDFMLEVIAEKNA